jgi:hypothetical protein
MCVARQGLALFGLAFLPSSRWLPGADLHIAEEIWEWHACRSDDRYQEQPFDDVFCVHSFVTSRFYRKESEVNCKSAKLLSFSKARAAALRAL